MACKRASRVLVYLFHWDIDIGYTQYEVDVPIYSGSPTYLKGFSLRYNNFWPVNSGGYLYPANITGVEPEL